MEHLSSHPEIALKRALAAAPHRVRTQDSWLFTYGAMLESPPFDPVDRQAVACPGWRRAFCLSDSKLRGVPERPGLTLGLVEGGQCVGMAWRLAAQTIRQDLARVFEAEMRLPFYRPAWLPIRSPTGQTTALVLVTDRTGPLFEPDLTEDQIVQRIATSSGPEGTNADYLRDVITALDRAGLADLYLNRLWSNVRNPLRRAEASGPSGGR